jgi:hypothetical protein
VYATSIVDPLATFEASARMTVAPDTVTDDTVTGTPATDTEKSPVAAVVALSVSLSVSVI